MDKRLPPRFLQFYDNTNGVWLSSFFSMPCYDSKECGFWFCEIHNKLLGSVFFEMEISINFQFFIIFLQEKNPLRFPFCGKVVSLAIDSGTSARFGCETCWISPWWNLLQRCKTCLFTGFCFFYNLGGVFFFNHVSRTFLESTCTFLLIISFLSPNCN